jgi:hypothetical protein
LGLFFVNGDYEVRDWPTGITLGGVSYTFSGNCEECPGGGGNNADLNTQLHGFNPSFSVYGVGVGLWWQANGNVSKHEEDCRVYEVPQNERWRYPNLNIQDPPATPRRGRFPRPDVPVPATKSCPGHKCVFIAQLNFQFVYAFAFPVEHIQF